jgi:DnaJ homolog subfamily C member 19
LIKVLLVALLLWLAWRYLRKPVTAKWQPVRDEAEARAVLGLGPDADADAIRAAHRRLAASVHPDRGGSAELAKRVNAARDLLLRRA